MQRWLNCVSWPSINNSFLVISLLLRLHYTTLHFHTQNFQFAYMESQLDRSHGHGRGQIHEQEAHHTAGHGTLAGDQDEQHHEKKSVMEKVKAKARKIKDTITKHGHGHDHDLDEEDDEEKEMVEDPEILGAPKYESIAVMTGAQVGNSETPGVNSGRSTAMEVDPLPPTLKPESHVHGAEGARGQQRVGSTTVTGEVPHAPQNTPVTHNAPGIHQTRDNVTGKTVMGDVPQPPQNIPESLDPPGIHHRKDDVPTNTDMGGGDVRDPSGIHHSRDDVPSRTVMGDVPHAPQNVPVSLDPPGVHYSRDEDSSRTFVCGQEERPSEPKVKLERPEGLEDHPAAPKDTPGAYTSNYQTKVTDPTGKGGEEAGICSVLHSFDKMNVYDQPEGKTRQEHNLVARDEDLLTNAPTGSHDQFSPELTPPKRVTAPETSDGTKPQEHLHDEGIDRPSNQGSYTEKISSVTSAIAGKAISAKNVVASKLGYGEKDNTGGHEMHPHEGGEKNPAPTSAVDYGKKVASTVTEKLAPVHGKVAGEGSVPGTGTGTSPGTHTDNQQQLGVEGKDKGVSVKDYFAEKLKPGEEDRALSEVMSEALHKRKPEQEQEQQAARPVREVVSDAVHKRNEEPDQVSRPMGKVTESEEVACRLGTTKDDNGIGNKGMVDKIKGAVGSWLGKGDLPQGSQPSSASDDDVGHNSNISRERGLQESGN